MVPAAERPSSAPARPPDRPQAAAGLRPPCLRQRTPRISYQETEPHQSSPPPESSPTLPARLEPSPKRRSPPRPPQSSAPASSATCNTYCVRASLLPSVPVRACRRIQTAQVGHKLPAHLLRQSAPARHPFEGLPVLDDPRDFAIGRRRQPLALQAWTRALALGIRAVALGAVIVKEILARRHCLRLSCVRIHTHPIPLRNLLQPRPIRCGKTNRRRSQQRRPHYHPGLHFVLRNQSRNCEISYDTPNRHSITAELSFSPNSGENL